MRGNSRDNPTPILHFCRKTTGCLFQRIIRAVVAKHELICNKTQVANAVAKHETARTVPCPWDGCNKMSSTIRQSKDHQRKPKEYVPRACPEGCDPGKLYTNPASYSFHLVYWTQRPMAKLVSFSRLRRAAADSCNLPVLQASFFCARTRHYSPTQAIPP